MNTTNMSSFGSTQNVVPAAPLQLNSPTEPPGRGLTRRGARGEAQPEAEAGTREIVRPRLDAGTQMIGGHVGHGLGTENPLAVERAAVEQHLGEARVVHGGAHHAPAPAF